MALIKCYECSAEISDKARSCPKCGAPVIVHKWRCSKCGNMISEEPCPYCNGTHLAQNTNNVVRKSVGTVVIYGYTGWFLVKPKLKIYLNGKYMGDVSYKAKTKEIPITEPTNIEIKCNMRSTLVRVLPNKQNEIYTEFDRTTGNILAELRSY